MPRSCPSPRRWPTIAAIHDVSRLLDDPDLVSPVLATLAAELRAELGRRAAELAAAQRAAVAELQAWPDWGRLDPAEQRSIVAGARLVAAGPPAVADGAALLLALDATPLATWRDRIGLVPGRRDQARQRAAAQLEPASVPVALPRAMLKNAQDLQAYVEELRARVQPHLDAGTTVIL